MAKIAFLGLGVMGFPMAGHIAAKGGHEVTVYNRTGAKSSAWTQKFGFRAAMTPREAVQNCDLALACVGDDNDLRSVVLGGDGAFAGMKKGAIFVDHTTASAQVARELSAQGRDLGLGYVDAPVSGGQEGAQKGLLTAMCGGEPEDYVQAEPIIACYTKSCRLMGPVGAGQLTKMVNQICIAGTVQGLAEALAFAGKAGLDRTAVLAAISKGGAQSWQMDNRGMSMVEGAFDFGFAVDWMRKDLSICLDEARRNGARLPVVALVDQFYADIQACGGGRQDTSSLIERLL